MTSTTSKTSLQYLYTYALWLGIFTVFYNLLEGIISILFGVTDDALTLFGFGVNSFIEVISRLGIITMVLRIRSNPDTIKSNFEMTALRITGTSFYLLSAGLLFTAVLNLVTGHKPETTLPGVIIALISIAVMWALVIAKRKVGCLLDSEPILADAN